MMGIGSTTGNAFVKDLPLIIAFGIVSLFADMAYEGMRGISGPFLASLGATGAAVGAETSFLLS